MDSCWRAGWAARVCPGPSLEWDSGHLSQSPENTSRTCAGVSLRQPGWGRCCSKETRGNKEEENMLDIQDSHCCSDQQPKDGSKIKLEAPLEMEEINTEHSLTTNQIVWIKEAFRLYGKLHCWYFLYFEDGTSYKLVRLLWYNYCWCGVITDVIAVWGIWILTVNLKLLQAQIQRIYLGSFPVKTHSWAHVIPWNKAVSNQITSVLAIDSFMFLSEALLLFLPIFPASKETTRAAVAASKAGEQDPLNLCLEQLHWLKHFVSGRILVK